MSTKVTLLYGDDFHIYYDYAEPTKDCIMEIKGERVDLPKELEVALRDLIGLHECFKKMRKLSKELDEVDGGLFSFNLKTGERGESK